MVVVDSLFLLLLLFVDALRSVLVLLCNTKCFLMSCVLWLFLVVPLVGLQYMIVVFPDHTDFFVFKSFCYVALSILSGFAIISLRKKSWLLCFNCVLAVVWVLIFVVFLAVLWVDLFSITVAFPGFEFIKLQFILSLKIKCNDWLLGDTCPGRKLPIIALYFESETVLSE